MKTPPNSAWHSGELATQQRAGVGAVSARGIRASIPEPLAEFIHQQEMAVFASIDGGGRTWASLRVAKPGFLRVMDEVTIASVPLQVEGDPLIENVQANPDVGILIVDLANRRRIRVNGEAEVLPGGGLRIHAVQVYGNCPQYIQERVREEGKPAAPRASSVLRNSELTPQQQDWIKRADTLFIATAHPEYGADASHRGGNRGFVKVESATRLIIPDYSGNNMFNTLGNLAVNPSAGLVFPDFERSRTLQLTGHALVDWNPQHSTEYPGALRLVDFAIEQVIEIGPLDWPPYSLQSFSPFNPQ